MALYGSAKAPAVPKYDDGTTVTASTDDTGGTASVTDTLVEVTDTTVDVSALINANFATINAKLQELIDHLNDGRTNV